MNLRAFLFDLDGTLVDTEQTWSVAISQYLADRGCKESPDDILKIVFGRSWIDIHHDIVMRNPSVSNVSMEQMTDELRDYYLRLRVDPQSQIIQSSVACLKRLAKIGPCVIVSGSTHEDILQAVELIGCKKEIPFVLGAEDYPRGKPYPDGYATAGKLLGVPPESCVVFEDAPHGVVSAKRAGMWCVALDRTGLCTDQLDCADWVVPDLSKFTPEAFAAALKAK